jgi:hypothetical protein
LSGYIWASWLALLYAQHDQFYRINRDDTHLLLAVAPAGQR